MPLLKRSCGAELAEGEKENPPKRADELKGYSQRRGSYDAILSLHGVTGIAILGGGAEIMENPRNAFLGMVVMQVVRLVRVD